MYYFTRQNFRSINVQEKRIYQDSPFDAPVSPEAAVKGLERTHVGVFRGDDLLREPQTTR